MVITNAGAIDRTQATYKYLTQSSAFGSMPRPSAKNDINNIKEGQREAMSDPRMSAVDISISPEAQALYKAMAK